MSSALEPPFEVLALLLVFWMNHLMRKIRPMITRTQKTSMKIVPNHPIPHPPIIPGPMCQSRYPPHWAKAIPQDEARTKDAKIIENQHDNNLLDNIYALLLSPRDMHGACR